MSHAIQVEDFEHLFERIGKRTLQLNARPIPVVGNSQLILLTIVDITQRKHMDTERAQLFTLERTTRSTADAANLAKDVFLSILSYELRSPLSAMLGWSRLLRSGKLTPAQVEHGLEVIDRSSSIQNQPIEDLLGISSITNGKLRLDAELIDLVPVIDNGKGIDPEFLPHVFDRFLQADSSAQRNYAGLGLGLTIVRHIVELHGGTSEAASEVGTGSTFMIRLPISPSVAVESAPPSAEAIDRGTKCRSRGD